MLGVLVGDIAGSNKTALKLIHPLLQYGDHILILQDCVLDWAFDFCFHLLEEGAPGKDHIRLKSVACLLQILHHYYYRLKRVKCTPAQFDMQVDYHLHICEGTDHDTISCTFMVLMSLGGWPSTPDQMGRYIDMMICFMDHVTMHIGALHAAWVLHSAVASIGWDNESLREAFSKALASMILLSTHTPLNYNPFMKITFFKSYWDMPYLTLVCTLAQEITWQPQLHQTGHFDNCLAITQTLSTEGNQNYDKYAVLLAHIFAIIDDSDEGYPLFHLLQACPSWPLLLRPWCFIFNLSCLKGKTSYTLWMSFLLRTASELFHLLSHLQGNIVMIRMTHYSQWLNRFAVNLTKEHYNVNRQRQETCNIS